MSESGDCRYEREGYCGYSQETVNALCKSRDDRIRELEAENKKLKERIAELEQHNNNFHGGGTGVNLYKGKKP